ncbi:unnamed protein product [Closterium sp. NIES-65]|nr:unnamed protein product [Closterium sp. NIES-65]
MEEASAAATPTLHVEVQQAGAAKGAWQAGGGGNADSAPGPSPSQAEVYGAVQEGVRRWEGAMAAWAAAGVDAKKRLAAQVARRHAQGGPFTPLHGGESGAPDGRAGVAAMPQAPLAQVPSAEAARSSGATGGAGGSGGAGEQMVFKLDVSTEECGATAEEGESVESARAAVLVGRGEGEGLSEEERATLQLHMLAGQLAVVGVVGSVKAGQQLRVMGRWVSDKYRQQLKAREAHAVLPQETDDIDRHTTLASAGDGGAVLPMLPHALPANGSLCSIAEHVCPCVWEPLPRSSLSLTGEQGDQGRGGPIAAIQRFDAPARSVPPPSTLHAPAAAPLTHYFTQLILLHTVGTHHSSSSPPFLLFTTIPPLHHLHLYVPYHLSHCFPFLLLIIGRRRRGK